MPLRNHFYIITSTKASEGWTGIGRFTGQGDTTLAAGIAAIVKAISTPGFVLHEHAHFYAIPMADEPVGVSATDITFLNRRG